MVGCDFWLGHPVFGGFRKGNEKDKHKNSGFGVGFDMEMKRTKKKTAFLVGLPKNDQPTCLCLSLRVPFVGWCTGKPEG